VATTSNSTKVYPRPLFNRLRPSDAPAASTDAE
jgi:hypothetical protein